MRVLSHAFAFFIALLGLAACGGGDPEEPDTNECAATGQSPAGTARIPTPPCRDHAA